MATPLAEGFGDFNRGLIADFRAHDGRITQGIFTGRALLVLTATGAKRGGRTATPLVYTWDGDRYVVIASKGGAPTHPAWYHNLVAHPEVNVEVGPETFRARAIVARPEAERRRLYDAQSAVLPGFKEYEMKTTRRIPVVLLERLA